MARTTTAPATPLPPYQPADEYDAACYAHQILGDYFDHAYTGDLADTLRQAADQWAPADPTA